MKTIAQSQFALLGVLLALATAAGCATKPFTSYQSSAGSEFARTSASSGLDIAVDPFTQRDRTKQYFGIEAVNDGLGILHIHAVNRTSDKTFLIEKKNIRLIAIGSDRSSAQNKIDRGTGGGEATAMVGAAALSLPLLFIGGAMISQATEIRRNFVDKEFQDQSLSPGQTAEGFIYFSPVPKKIDWTAGASLTLTATDTRSRTSVPFNIPLHR